MVVILEIELERGLQSASARGGRKRLEILVGVGSFVR
jgi:hypothetical protein